MDGFDINEFYARQPGTKISRLVYMWSLIIAISDRDLDDGEVYYLMESVRQTGWAEYAFFHLTRKLTLDHPPADPKEWFAEIERRRPDQPSVQGKIRDFVWERFRLGGQIEIRELPGIERTIVYHSLDFGAYTVNPIRFCDVKLSPKQATACLLNDAVFPFSQEELKGRARTPRFANPVELAFGSLADQVLPQITVNDINAMRRVEEVTVMFTDMKDFSALVRLTDRVFKDDVALFKFGELCKRYQLPICRSIRLHGGEILHTAGDAFIALFRGGESAATAFACAKDVIGRIGVLRGRAEYRDLESGFVTRIGLSSGNVQYGFLGPYELKERTVFGRCVNIGARLESKVKNLCSTDGVLVDESVFNRLDSRAKLSLEEASVDVKEVGAKVRCYLWRPGPSVP